MNDSERLVVMLEARVSEFEKRMRQAENRGTRTYTGLRRGSRSATRQMEADMVRSTGRINQALAQSSTRIGAYARSTLTGVAIGATAALAPLLSVAAALNTARRALDDFSKTGDVAARLGVNVERLQELRYAAEQGGMAVDNFDLAFRRFIRRSAEAAQGTGVAKGAFEELGIELRDQNGRLKEGDRLLGEVADALRKVQSPADRLRLAFAMFDSDGAGMVNVLARGSEGLDEFARKARDLGIVVDRDLIARSQDLSRELETAQRVIDLNFKQALVDLAPVLISTAQLVGRLAGGVSRLVDSMRSVQNMSTSGLTSRLAELRAELATRPEVDIVMGVDGKPVDLTQALRDEISRVEREIFGRAERESMEALSATLPPIEIIAEDDSGGGSSRGSGRNAAASAALREAEAVRALIENLEHERSLIGLSDVDRAKANALRQAGAAATAEQRRKIEDLVESIHAETEAMQAATEASLFFRDMTTDAFMSIIPAIDTGNQALDRLLDTLIKAVAQAALLGDGPLAGLLGGGGGLLGGLFSGPGFSRGTANTGGHRGEVRGVVHGQEAVIPLPSGGRVPVEVRGGGAQEVRVHVTVGSEIDDSGNLLTMVRDVAVANARAVVGAEMEGVGKTFGQKVHTAMLDPRKR